MVDAVTQTERSDYHQLKVRDLKKQLRRLEAEAAEVQKTSDKLAQELKQKEISALQLRIENLMKEDPKNSAAPRSGVNPIGTVGDASQEVKAST